MVYGWENNHCAFRNAHGNMQIMTELKDFAMIKNKRMREEETVSLLSSLLSHDLPCKKASKHLCSYILFFGKNIITHYTPLNCGHNIYILYVERKLYIYLYPHFVECEIRDANIFFPSNGTPDPKIFLCSLAANL